MEMLIGDRVVEPWGPNQVIGSPSLIDGRPPSSVRIVQHRQRKFRFMLDEVPYFALYIIRAMARRIRALDANVGT
jgi:hypothetical protein